MTKHRTGIKRLAMLSGSGLSLVGLLVGVYARQVQANAEKLADVKKSFYKKAVDEGNGDLFISELIQKD